MSVASAIAGGGAGGGGGGTVTTTGGTSTDNAIARFDGTDGTKIQDSAVFIDDSANITGIQSLTATGDLNATGGTVSAHEVYTTAGTLTAVAHGFTGDLNTGLYSPGADQAAVVTGGTARLTVSTTAVTSTLPVVAPAGAIATPSVTTTGDLDTGVYFPAANTVAIAAGGVDAARFNAVASSINYLDVTPGASGNPVLLKSTAVAGTGGISVIATAPAATTGASVAGKPAAVTASAAVASTDTNGAAAGGTVTISGGAATRLVSGTANGGDVILTGGAGIGTGTSGQVKVTVDGSSAKPSVLIGTSTAGFYQASVGAQFSVNSTNPLGVLEDGVRVRSSVPVCWSAGNPDANGPDFGIARVTTNVGKLTTGGTTLGGWMQWAGQQFLGSDQTNATTTLASTTLSVTLAAGRNYSFKCILYLSDSVAADGAKIDFAGGTVTATTFRAHATAFDTALNLSSQTTALNTSLTATTFTGAGMYEIHGSIVVNAGGTFIPQFAQAAHTTGTLTLAKGSHMLFFDMP